MSASAPRFAFSLVAMLLLGALTPGCTREGADAESGKKDPAAASEQEEKATPVPVEVAVLGTRTLTARHTGTAALEARGDAQATARTSGIALQVLAEEGQLVRAGQPLARLDAERARLQVAQTDAQVAKLEANYRRARQLAEQQLISANDVDQLRFDLENARAANHMARLEVSYATVDAPISGVIASRMVKPGNFVQINSPVFRIVDISRLEATLNVPERDIVHIRVGQSVSMQVDALPGEAFAGQVVRVAPVVDAGSGTFRVVSAFDSRGRLQPGMFGRLSIDYQERADILSLPRMALLDDSGDPAVFVVRGDKAERVSVKLGQTDGDHVEVLEGLSAGDTVVVAGKSALREGSVVEVLGGSPKNTPTGQ